MTPRRISAYQKKILEWRKALKSGSLNEETRRNFVQKLETFQSLLLECSEQETLSNELVSRVEDSARVLEGIFRDSFYVAQ